MKTKMKVTLALLALGASALVASAQDAGRPPNGNRLTVRRLCPSSSRWTPITTA